jgi:hypothetical protein
MDSQLELYTSMSFARTVGSIPSLLLLSVLFFVITLLYLLEFIDIPNFKNERKKRYYGQGVFFLATISYPIFMLWFMAGIFFYFF